MKLDKEISDKFLKATTLHTSGKLEEAKKLYKDIISR